MAPVLSGIFKAIFIYIEPIQTFGGAYACYASPEWFLTRLIPGPTETGLVHTTETVMAVRQYGAVLFLLGMISIGVFSAAGPRSDPLALSVTRRLLFVLAGNPRCRLCLVCGWEAVNGSGGCGSYACYGDASWMGFSYGCVAVE